MIPTIYEPKEKDFSHNGLGFLKDCTRCDIFEEKNSKYELELEYPAGTRFDEYFENDFQIKAKPNDQEDYHVFYIDDKVVDTFTGTVTLYGQSRTYKLGRRGITKLAIESKTGSEAMKLIQSHMDISSDIQLYSDITTVSSTTFEARNVLNCIAGEQGSLLQFWGGEIKREPFKLSLLKRRGRDDVGIVRYGKDLTGLKMKLDWKGLKTRVIPYADIQNSVGLSERIYGDPVDSPYINNYPDVYTDYVQFSDDQGAKDLASLNRVAKSYFVSINPGCDKPKVNLDVELVKLTDTEEAKEFAKLRNYGLFDTFTVYHKRYKINLDSKVVGIVYDSLAEKTKKITAGDSQIAFYQQQSNDVQEELKKYATNSYMSKFSDYVSDMITGNIGGHVVVWPKEKPSDILIMDHPDINKAKEVLRLNKSGIGFSEDGFNGKYKTGWSIDGNFNANFIQSGKIRADIFETSFNAYGDQLKLSGGALQAVNNGIKLMELTKKGMEFWGTNKQNVGHMGVVTDESNPFRGYAITDPLNNMLIRTYDKDILFATNKDKGMLLGRDGKLMLYKGVDVYPRDGNLAANFYGDVEFTRNVNIKGQLTLNGQQVFPGQGGGASGSIGGQGNNWNGQYPPEVSSQADKFAWQAWVMLLSLGYSKAAAAGILGNINGESGPAMNPDIDQIGGPAYGAIQFDGSSYPLLGAPTYNGREYVQRLMNAAGIKEDYRQMAPQMRLVDWANHNGQWIGAVQPLTVAGFKAIGDPSQAAYAFEKNFERPRDSHPDRQGYAVTWYNKFKDLQIPQANSDIVTVAKSMLNFFTYQLIHGEAYIGSVQNVNPNGVTDCSGYVWLVLAKAGYRVPGNMGWYTGSMTGDARGAHRWFQEIAPEQSKAGDVVIYNVGGGAGANGHTAILLESYRGSATQIIQMGGDGRWSGVNISTIGYSFGSLLGGDRCIARALK